jgi:hypothetical protein
MPLDRNRIKEIISETRNPFHLTKGQMKEIAKIFSVDYELIVEIVEDLQEQIKEREEDKEDEDRYIANAQKQLNGVLAKIDVLRKKGELKKYRSKYAKMRDEDPDAFQKFVKDNGPGLRYSTANLDPAKDVSGAHAEYQEAVGDDMWDDIKKIVADVEKEE